MSWYEEYGITKPFYGDDWVCILKGDCREILPQLPDNSVDLVLTDPDYKYNNEQEYKQFCQDWFRICKQKSENIVFTSGVLNMWFYPKPRWVVCWYKSSSRCLSKIGGFQVWEPILLYGSGPYRFGHDILRYEPLNFIREEWAKHSYPKNPDLWAQLVNRCSKYGQTILDPFLGSGTTAYCAKKLNRHCIGIEIEEKYCEIAANRCRQMVMDLRDAK